MVFFRQKTLIFNDFGTFFGKNDQIWQNRKVTKPSDSAFNSIPDLYKEIDGTHSLKELFYDFYFTFEFSYSINLDISH